MRRRRNPKILLRLALIAVMIITAMPALPFDNIVSVADAANTRILKLQVISARDEPNWKNAAGTVVGVHQGDIVPNYKFIINQDTSGNPLQARYPNCSPFTDATNTTINTNYPNNCNWPSIHQNDAYNPIVAQGTQANLNATTGLNLTGLPNGNYLISVWADGYKIDGTNFSLPLTGASGPTLGLVTVAAQPYPLPLAAIKLQTFEDCNTVNGQFDSPGEESTPGVVTCTSDQFKLDLPNFKGKLFDVLGEVTTDWFGNPLCTVYAADAANTIPAQNPTNGNLPVYLDPTSGRPIVFKLGAGCHPDTDGVITFNNMGPNRYTSQVVPPDGSNYIQTTTLEGNHDYDVWTQEGATGFDTEMIGPGGEPVPPTPFGYVSPTNNPTLVKAPTTGTAADLGSIKGWIRGSKTYIPQQGGLPYNGQNGGVGASGTKIDPKPITDAVIALSALQGGDRPVYIGMANTDGTFQINNVPNGDYSLTYWDKSQEFLLDTLNVTVANGQVADTGTLLLAGWWTTFEGRVCIDQNGNGKCEANEPGIPNAPVQLLSRANNTLERGISAVSTDNNGNYIFREAYPMTFWLVEQVYMDRFKTVGVTYQADNDPNEHTILGVGPDVSVFPVIGLSGRMDWALQPYNLATLENGGIVGTVTYDSTRNELNAREAVTEIYQPGIPNIPVRLYATTSCTPNPALTSDPTCTSPNGDGKFYLTNATTGALVKGHQLNEYISEQWQRPTDCTPLDVNGAPVVQLVTPRTTGKDCLEAPFMGTQFQTGFSTVDGNYGFSTVWRYNSNGNPVMLNGKHVEDPMPIGDYIVDVNIPNDKFNKPQYEVTKEEDVNIFTGDAYTPQVLNPPCVGPLHVVDVKGILPDGANAVDNPAFAAGGGSPFEGKNMPLCDARLFQVKPGKAASGNFNLFTQVPIPGKLWGLINDDLNLSTNPQDIMFGEKRGLANVPVGIYDYSNRLITTVMSDPNGFYEVILPSTSTYNCPLPAGPCPNVYRLVGNDPGQPGNLNPYYNPQYRTISASFEVWPGLVIPADHAPIAIGSMIATPGSQNNQPAQCKLDTTTPQILAVEKPYIRLTDTAASKRITINGTGFGTTAGQVLLDGVAVPIVAGSWQDGRVVMNLANYNTPGTHQLVIKDSNGQSTVTNLTFHVLGTVGPNSYTPTLYEVGYGTQYGKYNLNNYTFPYTNTAGKGPIQTALDDAATKTQALVVVYPGTGKIPTNRNGNSLFNANGAYFENLVIHSNVKLQGVGPGGFRNPNSILNTTVNGTVIDGLAFGDETYGDTWRTNYSGLAGATPLGEGSVITVIGNNSFNSTTWKASIDGLLITGGDQMGQNSKANSVPGGVVVTQGGGIFAYNNANNLQITNNIIRSNGGAYGGGLRVGTPFANSSNANLKVSYNRIISSGGTNLAGGIGLFNGSNGYEIDHNDVCGNYSGEYGGGISQYGYSPNGKIHDNRIYFNTSFDEGGGIFLAGELPANPLALSAGTGPVDVYNNLIQANLANDDGGGIRLLMVENFPINLYNNMIVNNVSTHEGGGIAMDDAPNTRIYNNTIMKNLTTATAATSNGQPAPAGISTTGNSSILQATLPIGSPTFSNPLLFNNILWDNRAGQWNHTTLQLQGIGLTGDTSPINYWDMGVADGSGQLSPTNSILQPTTNPGVIASPTNILSDPLVVDSTYNVSVAVFPWRTNPTFTGATVVALDLPVNLMGNYHLSATSPALNLGAASKVIPSYQVVNGVTNLAAPAFDIDNQARPLNGGFDAGADER
ncbi:MAG: hypothetical protein HXX08_09130 [Chloroflexi bacterium]|uniref:SD-repeat containing protein B domain-containing protein n=1 Tax=Candidatus Chlorohelix allophototropha TaxID=3003348 RepID=A0A8T7M354_9CHLR|nr:hypothetical protein [Chloroflexota bacterium]WJW67886.1 hypothetical protein OZ401_001170 [Chloroflexota bacterium L227-S17]